MEAKWERAFPCLQILSGHFEIMFTAWTRYTSENSAMRFCVRRIAQCEKMFGKCTINSKINDTPKGLYLPISSLHSNQGVANLIAHYNLCLW